MPGIASIGNSPRRRDWAEERTTFSRSVCEAALAHVVKDKTEAAYFRTDLFAQGRKLMDTWAKRPGLPGLSCCRIQNSDRLATVLNPNCCAIAFEQLSA